MASRNNLAAGLSRRDFLGTGLLTGAAAALPAHAVGQPAAPAAIEPFELDELTIADLQAGLQSGRFSSRALVAKYQARIENIDRRGPTLRSVIELNPDATASAEALDKERKEKGVRGPLHGIPILIKDNIDTADRLATTAGSLALVGTTPAKDAFLVRRLREAGAVLLGKTNLSEWANFRSSKSTSGWSARGGLTKNPYALDRNASGSSSGSAVAAAASLCAAAVGTETDGSITSPASANGIVGLKPTVGLISRSGVIPIAHSQDTAGPMCRTVRDAAVLLSALAGVDAADSATQASAGKNSPDYARFLDAAGLRGARIGVVRKLFGFHEAVDALIESSLEAMKRGGATLVDPAEFDSIGKLDEPEMTVLLYEFKADLSAYLAGRGAALATRTLKDLIAFNEKHRKDEMPFFGQDLLLKAEAKGPLTEKEYVDALATGRRLAGPDGIDAVMAKHNLDALVAPAGGPAWLTDLVTGDHYTGGSSTPAAVAGYPHIVVPAGFIFSLPVGISFFGRAWSEPTLFKLAYAFEQATQARRPPKFLPTARLEN